MATLDLEACAKAIEEAEMLSAVATPGPWNPESGRGKFAIHAGGVPIAGVLYEPDRDFIAQARALLPLLAEQLKLAISANESRGEQCRE